jgi:hypothetical protein
MFDHGIAIREALKIEIYIFCDPASSARPARTLPHSRGARLGAID